MNCNQITKKNVGMSILTWFQWMQFNECNKIEICQTMSILRGCWFGRESAAKPCPFCRGPDLDVNRQPNHVLFAGVLIWTWFDLHEKMTRHQGYNNTRKCTYFNSSRWFTSTRIMRCNRVQKCSLFVSQADRSLDQSTLGNFMTGLCDFCSIQISN